jgi:hypothetical protein
MCFSVCVHVLLFFYLYSNVFVQVLISETLNTVGVCLFAFHVLPAMDSLRGLVLCVGVAFVPALLKIFDR